MISNQTFITNQPYFINSYLSNVTIDNSTFYDINSDGSILTLIDTVIKISNVEAYGLHTASAGRFIKLSFNSVANFSRINYTDSTMKLIESQSSQSQIMDLMATNISLTQHLIDYIDCNEVILQNSMIYNVNSTSSYLMYAARSSLNQISNMTVHDINVAVFNILRSNVSTIDNLYIHNVANGIHFHQSSVDRFMNSRIHHSGSKDIKQGGALLIQNSNSTIHNLTFDSNTAQSGGAINID